MKVRVKKHFLNWVRAIVHPPLSFLWVRVCHVLNLEHSTSSFFNELIKCVCLHFLDTSTLQVRVLSGEDSSHALLSVATSLARKTRTCQIKPATIDCQTVDAEFQGTCRQPLAAGSTVISPSSASCKG